MVTAPVVNFPAATAVYEDLVGVIVAAACVDNYEVLLPLTVILPEVPLVTKPEVIEGVTFYEAAALAVIRPVLEFTEMVGFAVIVVDGVVALPAGTEADA